MSQRDLPLFVSCTGKTPFVRVECRQTRERKTARRALFTLPRPYDSECRTQTRAENSLLNTQRQADHDPRAHVDPQITHAGRHRHEQRRRRATGSNASPRRRRHA